MKFAFHRMFRGHTLTSPSPDVVSLLQTSSNSSRVTPTDSRRSLRGVEEGGVMRVRRESFRREERVE